MPKVTRESAPSRNKFTKLRKSLDTDFSGTAIKATDYGDPLGEVNIPPSDLRSYCLFLYGEKGVGKSSLFAQFPDSLDLMCEPRRRSLRIRMREIRRFKIDEYGRKGVIPPWVQIRDSFDAILESKGKIATVGIDNVLLAYKYCLDFICYENGVTYPPKDDFGRTWNKIKEEFDFQLSRLLYAGIMVIPIAHSKVWDKDSDTSAEEELAYKQPAVSNASGDILKALADYVVYYGFEGTRRVFAVRGTEKIFASCGDDQTSAPRFMHPSGYRYFTVPAGNNATEAYQNLTAAFENKAVAGARVFDEEGVIVDVSDLKGSSNTPKKSFRK